jgi:hypothetical protein
VLLFLGFIWDGLCWWKVLRIHGVDVPWRFAVASHGMPIFAKYMPGKVWTILGRAAYVSIGKISLGDSTFISAKAQIVLIFVGLLVSIIPYVIISGISVLSLVALVVTAIIFVFLLSRRIQCVLFGLMSRVFKREFGTHVLTLRQSWQIGSWYFFYWLLMMTGYWFLAVSMFGNRSIIIAFALPVSTTIGILAIVMPGGLGVREGVMVGFLSLVSVPLKDALTLAILARLWFLLGELFIFVLAVLIRGRIRDESILQHNLKYGRP